MGNQVRGSVGTASTYENSIHHSTGKAYRSTNVKQPLSNNYINRSLQNGGMPAYADTMSMGTHGVPGRSAYMGANVHADGHGGETINTTNAPGGDPADPNGVSLTNLLTNIKVQRPSADGVAQ